MEQRYVYRVILKVGYCDIWVEFNDPVDAEILAETILTHQVPNDDTKKRPVFVAINLVDKEAEAAAKAAEEADDADA